MVATISAELRAMIDLEVGKESAPPPPSDARWDRISSELWAMIDAEQVKDLPPSPWNDPPDVPLYLVAPLSAEQERAAEEADAARRRLDDKIRALHERRAVRALNCGKGRALHLRRASDAGGVDDALIRTSCGRSDCPHCWRRRQVKTYRRAARSLLDAPGDGNRPRVGILHCGVVDWLSWDTLDRGIRRKHGGDCGRLRVRQSDNRVLVICEQPFPGSRPMTPATALGEASAAIDQMHTARHSYRQLGSWSDRKETEWRLIEKIAEPIDFGAVQDQLAELGRKVRRLNRPDLTILLWRVENEKAADLLFDQVCPTLASKKEGQSPGTNSDTGDDIPAGDDEWAVPDDDGWTPFDHDEDTR